MYLQPVSPLNQSVTYWHETFGILNSPNQSIARSKIVGKWAMDNGAFSNWSAIRFIRALVRYQGLPDCLFVVSPDVVGNHEATLKRFWIWHTVLREYGYPVAFVLQNGITNAREVPFNHIDALFIGGSTAFKYTPLVKQLVSEGKKQGKWIHMGRVNSFARVTYAHSIGCDSVDGTQRAFDQLKVTRYPAYLQHKQESLKWD